MVRRCFQIKFCSILGARYDPFERVTSEPFEEAWPLIHHWGGLTLFSLPLKIAHAFCTGLHCHASVIDRPRSYIPNVMCWEYTFAHGGLPKASYQHLKSIWKVCNSKRIYCETRFTNLLITMRYFCHLKTFNIKLQRQLPNMQIDKHNISKEIVLPSECPQDFWHQGPITICIKLKPEKKLW